MAQELNELRRAKFGKVHIPGWTRTGSRGSPVNDPPNPAAFAIYPSRISLGVLVTGVFITPVRDPERPIRPNLLADRTEPTVGGGKKVLFSHRLETRAISKESILVQGVLVNVAHEDAATVFLGKLVALVNADTAV